MTTMKGAFSLVYNPSLFLTSPSLLYRVPHEFKCLSSPPSSFTRIVCKAATNLHADVRIPEKENNFPQLATDPEDEEKESISRISVPRERYISVSKVQLLQALASLFQNPKDAQQFLDIATRIDCILHAEHKSILEEMRSDYCFTHGLASDLSLNSGHEYSTSNEGANFEINGKVKDTNVSPPDEVNSASSYIPSNHSEHGTDSFAEYNTVTANEKASITADVRFQQNFMRLLHAAEFQELSAYDLQLSSALNSDYLLTLPIDVDWKRASLSNPIIFRRGYTTEKQEGLLLGEKFDYLQSRILQKIFGSLSTPVISIGMWMNKKMEALGENVKIKAWMEGTTRWLKEPLWPKKPLNSDRTSNGGNFLKQQELPIWLAAQEAIPRYENFLTSAGSRGRLLRKFLAWIGIIPRETATPLSDKFEAFSDPYLRENFLSRVSLRDIWKPATAEACGYNAWKQIQAAFLVLLSQSQLQEPAFKELVLLYTGTADEITNENKKNLPSLQLKIYNKIPLPDLKVIFPNKKLSFRILDTVRLDTTTILGLSAYFINYRFEDISGSISAFTLDLVAFGALIVFLTRVVLGYKQTWDRYQLLVNRALYQKTLASGFGAVHFLVDASEQQQFKEAILVYGLLLQQENHEVNSRQKVALLCENFLFNKFKEKIEMPIDKALEMLLRLGLVTEDMTMREVEGKDISVLCNVKVVPYTKSYKTLETLWSNLLTKIGDIN